MLPLAGSLCDLLPLSAPQVGQRGWGIFSKALTMDCAMKKRNNEKSKPLSWEEFRSSVTPPVKIIGLNHHCCAEKVQLPTRGRRSLIKLI